MFRLIVISLILGACTSQEEIRVVEGRQQIRGMKTYKECNQAPKYLIFPKPYPIFTMKGVKFPIKIIGLKDGKVIYEKIHFPGEHPIKLPNPELVIEVPICN